MTEEVDLNSQEVKDAIAAAVDEAVGGLKAKNSELLGKLKKAQQGQSIDPAELLAVETERDALKRELSKAQKEGKAAAQAIEDATKRAESAESAATRLLADNGLNEALAKAGVTNPALLKAAKALHASQVQIVAEGDNRVAKVGDKALADFITEWAGSDEGKNFVTAAEASGGGAQNSGGATHKTAGDAGGDKAARLARANELLKQNNSLE